MLKCFFERNRWGCAALTEKNCVDCKFYKTQKEYDDGLKTAKAINKIKGIKYTVEEKRKEERRQRDKKHREKIKLMEVKQR